MLEGLQLRQAGKINELLENKPDVTKRRNIVSHGPSVSPARDARPAPLQRQCQAALRGEAGCIGCTATLWANDREAGHGRIDRTVFRRFSGYSAMAIGRDNGPPVDSKADGDTSLLPLHRHREENLISPCVQPKRSTQKAAHEVRQHMATAHGISTQSASALAHAPDPPPLRPGKTVMVNMCALTRIAQTVASHAESAI